MPAKKYRSIPHNKDCFGIFFDCYQNENKDGKDSNIFTRIIQAKTGLKGAV